MKKDFKKSDLKTGYIVETVDGRRSKVLLNTSKGDVLGGNSEKCTQTWCPLSTYDDYLRKIDRNMKAGDIVKVWDFLYKAHAASVRTTGTLLWERPKPIPQLTMEEVIEKVGFEFEIVEEKKPAKEIVEEKKPAKEIVEKEEIFKELQNIIIMDILGFDPLDITINSDLWDDLDCDFFDMTKLIKKIEEFFKMSIPSAVWMTANTVGDLVNIIYNKK